MFSKNVLLITNPDETCSGVDGLPPETINMTELRSSLLEALDDTECFVKMKFIVKVGQKVNGELQINTLMLSIVIT